MCPHLFTLTIDNFLISHFYNTTILIPTRKIVKRDVNIHRRVEKFQTFFYLGIFFSQEFKAWFTYYGGSPLKMKSNVTYITCILYIFMGEWPMNSLSHFMNRIHTVRKLLNLPSLNSKNYLVNSVYMICIQKGQKKWKNYHNFHTVIHSG